MARLVLVSVAMVVAILVANTQAQAVRPDERNVSTLMNFLERYFATSDSRKDYPHRDSVRVDSTRFDRGRGDARIDSGRLDGRFDGRVDSGRFDGRIDSGRFDGRVDSGRFDGRIDSGRFDGRVDTGRVDDRVDSGRFDGRFDGRIDPGRVDDRIDSGRFDGRIDPGRVDDRIDSGRFDGRIDSGRIDSGRFDDRFDSRIDTGRVDDRFDSGRIDGRIDSGRVDGRIDSGRVDDRIDTGRVDSGRGDGRIDSGRTDGSRPGVDRWDWQWDRTAVDREVDPETTPGGEAETDTVVINRLSSMVEDLQIRLFMDNIRQTYRGYQEMCPKLMDLLERGFLRQWLHGYLQQRPRAEEARGETRPEREGEWTTDFNRFLRGRDTSRAGGWRDQTFADSHNLPVADANNPVWQGLVASCYIYQEIVQGNVPRLDGADWGRSAAQATQQ